ncbi:hypothetical protein RND71_011518 [Anisodus tanguticus]|uniref:Uncharacterized protein n=1 Tax=Anisodus tanguticus TaxID=243964 RepID=A0AAE1SDJ4_9SOLA|nr:hypothetical protein RND71_011518 [Anisodus tanguticus]
MPTVLLKKNVYCDGLEFLFSQLTVLFSLEYLKLLLHCPKKPLLNRRQLQTSFQMDVPRLSSRPIAVLRLIIEHLCCSLYFSSIFINFST